MFASGEGLALGAVMVIGTPGRSRSRVHARVACSVIRVSRTRSVSPAFTVPMRILAPVVSLARPVTHGYPTSVISLVPLPDNSVMAACVPRPAAATAVRGPHAIRALEAATGFGDFHFRMMTGPSANIPASDSVLEMLFNVVHAIHCA